MQLEELYEELKDSVRGMATMAAPGEINAALEDKEASPPSATRTLTSAVERTSAQQRTGAGAAASVSRGAGFEDAVLAHLGAIADAMQGIAVSLGAKPKTVKAALQVLNSPEAEDKNGEKQGSTAAATAAPAASAHHSHLLAPVRVLLSCAHVRFCTLVVLLLSAARSARRLARRAPRPPLRLTMRRKARTRTKSVRT